MVEAHAGTLTNETPEMLPAIMPKATMGQGGGTGGTVESGIAGVTVTTFGETREENEQGKIDREADEHEKHDAQL